jgi:hypothetical protein
MHIVVLLLTTFLVLGAVSVDNLVPWVSKTGTVKELEASFSITALIAPEMLYVSRRDGVGLRPVF